MLFDKNGDPVFGSTSGGGGGGVLSVNTKTGNVLIPEVVNVSGNTISTVNGGVNYIVGGTVNRLTIGSVVNSPYTSKVYFTTGSNPVVELPTSLALPNKTPISIVGNKHYCFTITNNCLDSGWYGAVRFDEGLWIYDSNNNIIAGEGETGSISLEIEEDSPTWAVGKNSLKIVVGSGCYLSLTDYYTSKIYNIDFLGGYLTSLSISSGIQVYLNIRGGSYNTFETPGDASSLCVYGGFVGSLYSIGGSSFDPIIYGGTVNYISADYGGSCTMYGGTIGEVTVGVYDTQAFVYVPPNSTAYINKISQDTDMVEPDVSIDGGTVNTLEFNTFNFSYGDNTGTLEIGGNTATTSIVNRVELTLPTQQDAQDFYDEYEFYPAKPKVTIGPHAVIGIPGGTASWVGKWIDLTISPNAIITTL